MIDIHHHCLPGVDDGPRDLSEAVDLCEAAVADGIREIVATPHVLRGRWQNRVPLFLEKRREELQTAVGDRVRIHLGCEYFFDFDMVEVLTRRETIIPLAGSRYFLVEFEAHSCPPLVENPFFEAQLQGWTPVIAHPERNTVLQSRPDRLAHLISKGARVQITAGSLLGDFGPEAEQAASRWIAQGMAHFVASDAHNTKRRPPRMRQARQVVEELVGTEKMEMLFERNPAAVLGNRQLEWEPEPELEEERPGALDRLRRMFGGRS